MEEHEKKMCYLTLENLISYGEVHEKYQNFKNSIFSDVYQRATYLVEQILEENDDWRKKKQRQEKGSFGGINVISFVGKRGTGKTSSMFSFADALEKHFQGMDYQNGDVLKFQKEKYKEVMFHVLKNIDASSLEESEDIFILILANMFERILRVSQERAEDIREYERRNLFQKFEKIYEDFLTLNAKMKGNNGYSTFEKLKNVAKSQQIRSNFEELVEFYLKEISDSESLYAPYNKETYLVITIDDVDMAKQRKGNGQWNWGSYKIMDSIYKYLSVPKVIILISYNNVNLYKHCCNYFIEQRRIEGCKKAIEAEEESECQKLASQFLEKVFPLFTRLYMPSLAEKNLVGEDEVKIKFTENDFKEIPEFQGSDEQYMETKKFCFRLVSNRTKVYFDCNGERKHFFEPDTLRSLYNIVKLLLQMKTGKQESGNEKSREKFERIQYNISLLKEDFSYRFMEENSLEEDELELFREWERLLFAFRSEEIYKIVHENEIPLGLSIREKYREILEKAEKEGNDKAKAVLNDVIYSYSELLHRIYHMTRGKHKYSKEFVSCILYSHTIYMTDIYNRYQWCKEQIGHDLIKSWYENVPVQKADKESETLQKQEIDKNKDLFFQMESYQLIFEKIIGHTICGRWTEYYFPKVRHRMTPEFLKQDRLQDDSYYIAYVEKHRARFELKLKTQESEAEESSVKIKGFLFNASFYTNVLEWTEDDIICCYRSGEFIFSIGSVGDRSSDFDLTGCFRYAFCYAKFLTKMKFLLMKALDKSKITNEEERYKDQIWSGAKDLIEKTFRKLWEEFCDWDQKYGNMMLPVYNLDITYNMIKRLFRNGKERKLPELNIEDTDRSFIREYKVLLGKYGRQLQELDDYYGLTGDERAGFYKTFIECPFYKILYMENKDKSIKKSIEDHIVNLIYALDSDINDLTTPD